MSTEGSLRRKIGEEEKEKEEFQLANLASLGSLASKIKAVLGMLRRSTGP